MPLIEVRGLTKSYETAGAPVSVLRDLDVSVEKGEMVAIVGASGVGKSTLLHVLGGLDSIDGGSVQIAGRALRDLSDAELVAFRNRHVGFVFQFHHLLPEFSALENAEMPMRIARVAAAERTSRAAGSARAGRPARAPDASSRDAVGRRTAAGGDCAGAGDAARRAARRRADRRSRRAHGRRAARAAARDARRTRPDVDHRHAQPAGSPPRAIAC